MRRDVSPWSSATPFAKPEVRRASGVRPNEPSSPGFAASSASASHSMPAPSASGSR